MSYMNSGREQLADWIERRGFSQREAATYFGWHETFISKILLGYRLPGLAAAVKIERHTGIPVTAWVPSEHDKPAAKGRHEGRKTARTGAKTGV